MIVALDAKQVQKRSTVAATIPTVPASNDHTDGSWSDKDIYSGEFFANETDELLFIRLNAAIKKVLFTDNTQDDTQLGSNKTVTIWGGAEAGAGLIVDGFLNASKDYDSQAGTIELHPDVTSITAIRYLRFEDSGGTQKAIFGRSDVEDERFDVFTVYSESTLFIGGDFIIQTTTGAFRLPVMTATQASALTPTEGDQVHVTTTNGTFLAKGVHSYEVGVWTKL